MTDTATPDEIPPPPTAEEIEALAADIRQLSDITHRIVPAMRALLMQAPDTPSRAVLDEALLAYMTPIVYLAGSRIEEMEEAIDDHALRVWAPRRRDELLPDPPGFQPRDHPPTT